MSVGGFRDGMCLEVLRRRCRLRVGVCVCGRLQKTHLRSDVQARLRPLIIVAAAIALPAFDHTAADARIPQAERPIPLAPQQTS